MKKEIWKYPLTLGDFELEMPKGAKILAFQVQHGFPQLWVLIDWGLAENNAKTVIMETRKFMIQGTGMHFDLDKGNYIGTIQQQGGALVWHLFEITK